MATDVSFVGVRIQGGLLPAELLSRLATGRGVDGMSSSDYRLAAGESVREAANRVWAYLTGVWAGYQAAREKLPEDDLATTLTRERWLLILLDQLGYGRVPTVGAGGIQVDGKAFPVSHQLGAIPIHLLGAGVDLDRRSRGVAGAATASPQSMVQELLNRSDDHRWAILSNGRTLRLLRDSTSLVGSAYVEFDLEAIFEGELFSDFLLLYTLCHHSRLDSRDDEKAPASSWLESWRDASLESGSRALNQLRDGVVEALQTLGTGFLAHPANGGLRDRVAAHSLSLPDVNHALLRVVYRLLFTFVAEDRGVILAPDASPMAKQRYAAYFSTARLRRIARRRRGGRHGDLWRAVNLVWDGLGSTEGRPELGIGGIGGLFQSGELDFLGEHELSNESLLKAVRALSVIREPESGFTRVVDHRNLGAEELGSIYESLLEFVPSWDPGTRTFTLGSAAGNARKTTGSYYTPTSLIDSLLDTALDPVLDRAAASDDPESAYLSLTVCDPACGSGHFLVAAARRIAKRVAALRTGDPEPPPERVRSAMSEVVGRCIYGVDVNPLAAELAKVSLWLETMDPGRPLAFLDAQIKVGNALIGATPALLAKGPPDAAFKPIEGDDKTVARELAKQNRAERSGQASLFESEEVYATNSRLAEQLEKVIASRAASLTDVHVAQQRLRAYEESEDYRRQRLAADAWCAAFVWPKTMGAPKPVTHDTVRDIERGQSILTETEAEIARLAATYRFFHWHLEFPHLFRATESDLAGELEKIDFGFDLVIGNPPWEQSELDETEYFAARRPEIAREKRATIRRGMIRLLSQESPAEHQEFLSAKRQPKAIAAFAKNSGLYPLSSGGRVNLYRLFAEVADRIGSNAGYRGLVLPTGIVSELAAAPFCRELVATKRMNAVLDFLNEKPFFEGIPDHLRFVLLTFSGDDEEASNIRVATLLREVPPPRFPFVELTADDISRVSSETWNVPLFADRRSAAMAVRTYTRNPLFSDMDLRTKQGFVNLSSDDSELRTLEQLRDLGGDLNGSRWVDERGFAWQPVWESKLFSMYKEASRTFEGVSATQRFGKKATARTHDPLSSGAPLPRYWISDEFCRKNWPARDDWLLCGKEIMNDQTSARTSVFTAREYSALAYTCQLVYSDTIDRVGMWHFLALFNSIPFDYFVRQKKTGPHLTASILRQLPVVSPGAGLFGDNVSHFTASRARYLTAAQVDVDSDSARAFRCEIDAACAIAYGLSSTELAYMLDSFRVLNRAEVRAWGNFRSRHLILDTYESMAKAIAAGVPYESPFDRALSEDKE